MPHHSPKPLEEIRAIKIVKCERAEHKRWREAWIDSIEWPDLTGVSQERARERALKGESLGKFCRPLTVYRLGYSQKRKPRPRLKAFKSLTRIDISPPVRNPHPSACLKALADGPLRFSTSLSTPYICRPNLIVRQSCLKIP
jgi:hypothetical protein